MATEGAIIPQLVESITQSSSPSSVPMAGGDISSSAHTTIPCQTEIELDEKTKKELFTDTFCRVCGAVLQFEAHRNAHYVGKRHAQKVRLYFLKQELDELTYKKKHKVDHVEFHVEKDSSQDKNKFCSLCNMVFSSPVVAQSHYIGKIHAKKLKQVNGESNELCTGSEENALAETAVDESNPSLSPAGEKFNQQDASADPSCGDNAIDLSDPNKYCKLCCASFNKPLVAQQHYNGKKHARNESRQRMMEEMGETGVPMDSGGEGIFVCPICSITLTSIEMYQSHMQGNKHQIKENLVANVMKTTKKSYESFQDELADYIKVQKARGLEPKTQFRQDDSGEEAAEAVPAPIHPKISAAAPYKYPPLTHPKAYPPYNPHPPPDSRLPSWDKHYWHTKPMPKLPNKPVPHRKHPRSSPDSSDDSSSSSDESNDSHRKEKKHKREHRSKDRKPHHSKGRRENGSSDRKKRKIEDSDSGKEDGEREKKAEEWSTDKSKHRKDKKKKEEQPADKEGKKHKKTKKIEDQRTEEEMLWDESILGF
ncbi:lysine-rich coiled-coil protein 1 [Anomaloglossus baeobatrachus]|uniref:lysine-rich coiled-coil protein 1 n=1 Tax=Anomaloglossus baeobatrachus TaxID=238106 RepID=UPI003F4F760B